MSDTLNPQHIIYKSTYGHFELRDFFAGLAMLGLTSGISVSVKEDLKSGATANEYAQTAYTIADAMLKAREDKET